MKETDLKKRTKQFALEIIRFFETLPKDEVSRILGRQLLRAGTSVGANYRAAKRAKSNADFIHKMGTVEEEADECGYWLELLIESNKAVAAKALVLQAEADELVAIAVSSINTARQNAVRGALFDEWVIEGRSRSEHFVKTINLTSEANEVAHVDFFPRSAFRLPR